MVDNPAFSKALVRGLQAQLPEPSYQVKLQDGQLLWTSQNEDQTVPWTHKPQTSWWLRLGIWLIPFLPLDSQL